MSPSDGRQVREGLRRVAGEYPGPLEVMVGEGIGDAERPGVEDPGLPGERAARCAAWRRPPGRASHWALSCLPASRRGRERRHALRVL
jgi:hypothetical protein